MSIKIFEFFWRYVMATDKNWLESKNRRFNQRKSSFASIRLTELTGYAQGLTFPIERHF